MSKLPSLESLTEEPRVRFAEDRNTIHEVETYLDSEEDIWEEKCDRTDKYYEVQQIEITLFREGDTSINFDFVDWDFWDTNNELGELISQKLVLYKNIFVSLLDEGNSKHVLCVGDFFELLGFDIDISGSS